MDGRFSLILGLGAMVLGGSAGCTPSFNSRQQNPPPQTSESQKVADVSTIAKPEEVVRAREKELPKRQPKASSCVAAGEFFYRESLAPDRTPEDQRQRREMARKAFEQALQIDPNCVEAMRGLARVYSADQDHQRAVAGFHAALKMTPKDANLWFELGMTHSRHKEWEPAIDALAEAVQLKPEERQYANVLGFCLARAGRYEESLAQFTHVVGEAKARYNVARMMHHLGQDDQSRQQLQLSLKLDPNCDEAKTLLTEMDAGSPKSGQAIVPVEYQEQQR
jgi:Tfp pilus assembly protein PilF